MPQLDRTGTIHHHDAELSIWEEPGGPVQKDWQRQFKREVFARIVQQLRRLGWTVAMPAIDPLTVQHYGGTVARWSAERKRQCRKGDLQADLEISGRHIEFKMFQAIHCPTRPDHEGRYEANKEAVAPYPLRLEMIRTRARLTAYLCNIFTGYTLQPPRIASPNPDPLAYFNDGWDSEHDKRAGTHRFTRGPDGWPDDTVLSSRDRTDHDGNRLDHGAIRWHRDHTGRVRRGKVYGGINGQWLFVYGPGPRDHTHTHAKSLFTYQPGQLLLRHIEPARRRKRLETELNQAVKAMNFERAARLRDLIFPPDEPLYVIWHRDHRAYHRPGNSGYTNQLADAGKFTLAETRQWGNAPNEIRPLERAA